MNKTSKIIGLGLMGVLLVGSITFASDINKLKRGDWVESEQAYYWGEMTEAEKNTNVKLKPLFKPSDPKYSTQKSRSMSNVGNIESVWDDYKGDDTIVAIIDTGIDYLHPDFYSDPTDYTTCKILPQSRYYYSSGTKAYYYEAGQRTTLKAEQSWNHLLHGWDKEYQEWDAHGTNTSGTAAASANGVGTVGIAPNAKILALRIDMSFTAINAAINYCVSLKKQGINVDVINMSLGAYSETFYDGYGDQQEGSASVATICTDSINAAYNAGIIVVAAAGNEKTDHYSYPACNDHVIGVGALNKNSGTTNAEFSNFNKTTDTATGNHNVDVAAPGYVYAPNEGGTQASPNHSDYCDTQGTSFSSPIVAGAACLWKQKHPTGTPDEFEEALYASCVDIGSTGWDYKYGYGRLDVANLLNYSNAVTGVEVSESAHTLYFGNGVAAARKSFELTAEVSPIGADDKVVTWSSSNNNVATVTNSGVVTATGVGTATITATTHEGGFTDTCLVTVEQFVPVTACNVTGPNGETEISIARGRGVQLNVEILPSNATDATFICGTDDTEYISVTEGGYVKGLKATSSPAYIYVMTDSDDVWGEIYVTVTQPIGGSTFLIDLYDEGTIGNTTASTGISDSYLTGRVTINGEPNNNIVSTGDKDNAVVGKNGGLTLGSSKNKGSVVFNIDKSYPIDKVTVVATKWDTGYLTLNGDQAKSGSLNDKDSKLGDCTNALVWEELGDITSLTFATSVSRLTIYTIECEYSSGSSTTVPVTGVSIKNNEGVTISNASLTVGEDEQLTAVVAPTNATNKTVTWTTTDSTVATVSTTGLVHAIKAGSATITATTADGNFTASVNFTVTAVEDSIVINESATVKVNETTTISATASGAVTWSKADGTGSISLSNQSNTGVIITGVSAGSATVTATVGSKSATCNVTVTSASSGSGEWKKVTNVSSLSAGDIVTFASEAYTATAAPMDGEKYIQSQSATFSSGTMTCNTAFEFTLGGSSGAWTFTSSEGTIGATAAKALSVTGGTTTWTISISDGNAVIKCTNTSFGSIQYNSDSPRFLNYATVQKAIQLYKKESGSTPDNPKTVDSVTVSPTTLNLDVNGLGNKASDTITATVNVTGTTGSVDTSVNWTTGNANVATVSNSGVVTAVGAGSTTITATSVANGEKFASCAVTVTANTRELVSIAITTNPTKTSYKVGETFDPTGAVVTATYNYAPTSVDVTSQVTWTPAGELTKENTKAYASFGGKSASVDITVTDGSSTGGSGSITITRNSFASASSVYGWQNWEQDFISGQAYIFGKETASMQFNGGKDGRTIFNSTAIPGSITKVTMNTASGTERSWKLLVGQTAFTTASGATNGTQVGSNQTVTTAGVSWTVTGSNSYFLLYLNETSASFIESITIEYGSGSTPDPVHVSGISLDKESLTMDIDDTETLIATITPDNADDKSVTWSSSDNNVATVDSSGKVTAVSSGSATITVRSNDTSTVYATCAVTVNKQGGGGGGSETFNTTIDFSTTTHLVSGYTGDYAKFTNEGVSFEAFKNESSTPVNNSFNSISSNKHTRFYTGNKITISAPEGYAITSLVFTLSSDGYVGGLENAGNWSKGCTCSQNSAVVTITVDNLNSVDFVGTSQYRIKNLLVTYVSGSSNANLTAAVNWAKEFNTSLVCNNGVTAPSTSAWASEATSYASLSSEAKAYLTNATYSLGADGETVTPGTDVNEDIAKAVAKYDYIIGKYGTTSYTNFMERSVSSNATSVFESNAGSMLMAVVIVGLSLTAASVYFFKKKKAN